MSFWSRIRTPIEIALTFAALLSVPYVIVFVANLLEKPKAVYRDLRTLSFTASCTQLGLSTYGEYEGRASHTRNESTKETRWHASALRGFDSEELLDMTGRYYPPVAIYFLGNANAFGDHIAGDTFQMGAEGDVSSETEDKSVPMECEIRIVCSEPGKGCRSPDRNAAE